MRLEERSTRVANLMLLTVLDEQQRVRRQDVAHTSDDCDALPRHAQASLIRSSIAIPAATFRITQLKNRLGGLDAVIA